jgi:hypothetical protein
MSDGAQNTAASRRQIVKSLAFATACAIVPAARSRGADSAARPTWHSAVVEYLKGLKRSDGGYGWPDQDHSHLTPTHAVIACYRLLGQELPDKAQVAQYVRTHHPMRLKKLEQEHREFEFQQIQSLIWLGEDASSFSQQVSSWTKPVVYMKQYEQHGYPVFGPQLTAFTCRKLLGMPLDDLRDDFMPYVLSRRREDGSFNNTPASNGGNGHVLNTWWGLQAMEILGRAGELKEQTVKWLQSCQLPNGGFTYQPNAPFAGIDDVAYAWAAARSLQLLGASPSNRDGCIKYLQSLRNSDDGFGDRPGWDSNPRATHFALDALAALDALGAEARTPARPPRIQTSPPSSLKVFTAQIEAHGNGSPSDAVELARALQIHLWGAKNANPKWIERAQAIADRTHTPVKFFVANEEYGTWVDVPGMGTYSHTSDIIAPAGSNFGASVAQKGVTSWPQFRQQRLDPLNKARGHLIWQFGENEELTRLYLDDSLERGGYAAISTFHFGNPDFTNSEPFLQRYRGRVPFIALQDAHGKEPWWFADLTTGLRTLFVASEPTYEAFLEAMKRNWVVAVRHDAVIGNQTWYHGGDDVVVDFVKERQAQWRWWDNPAIQRPMVSLVALRPQDEFENGRRDDGVTLRVRCAWENTTQGLPKKPLAELVKLEVDGAEVKPALVTANGPRQARGGQTLADQYYQYPVPQRKGTSSATAYVSEIATGRQSSQSIQFDM